MIWKPLCGTEERDGAAREGGKRGVKDGGKEEEEEEAAATGPALKATGAEGYTERPRG